MRATEILAEEHRQLFRALARLESLVEDVACHGLDAALARDLLDFLERHADACLEAAVRGDARGLERFVDSGRLYVSLQRDHAEREDRMLLPLAEEVLGQADDAEMVVGFRRLERDHFGPRGGRTADAVDALCARVESGRTRRAPRSRARQGVARELARGRTGPASRPGSRSGTAPAPAGPRRRPAR